eukprot:scaffold3350_cov268-Pinguiococcus_pyrenoidosus.AAC.11
MLADSGRSLSATRNSPPPACWKQERQGGERLRKARGPAREVVQEELTEAFGVVARVKGAEESRHWMTSDTNRCLNWTKLKYRTPSKLPLA